MNVLLPPHEFYALEGHVTEPTDRTLRRTIFVCAEQPGTAFFDDRRRSCAERAGAVLDINRESIARVRPSRGRGVRHFPLGWTPTWSHVEFEPGQPAGPADRPIDVLHLGIYSWHRAERSRRPATSFRPTTAG